MHRGVVARTAVGEIALAIAVNVGQVVFVVVLGDRSAQQIDRRVSGSRRCIEKLYFVAAVYSMKHAGTQLNLS